MLIPRQFKRAAKHFLSWVQAAWPHSQRDARRVASGPIGAASAIRMLRIPQVVSFRDEFAGRGEARIRRAKPKRGLRSFPDVGFLGVAPSLNTPASQSSTLAPTMRPSFAISMTRAAARPTRERVEELMIERMGENDKIVTRYMDDREFQGSAFPILAKEIFETIRGARSQP